MRRIIHLSDLHYGRVDAALETPLIEAVTRLKPDLTVISGDFTQRARRRQFAQARAFLDRVPGPVLCVPGNHDTPLDNLFLRFLRPFYRYKHFINRDLEPVFEDTEMLVAGVNTVNRFAWQSGKVGTGRLRRLATRMEGAGDRLRVAVLHHPLEHAPGVDKRLMRGASAALEALSEAGADLVLSGHLHRAGAEPFRTVPGLLFVQAGTGLSTRLRDGQGNTFNQIDYDGEVLRITQWDAERGEAPGFFPAPPQAWQRGAEGWERLDPAGAGAPPAQAAAE